MSIAVASVILMQRFCSKDLLLWLVAICNILLSALNDLLVGYNSQCFFDRVIGMAQEFIVRTVT